MSNTLNPKDQPQKEKQDPSAPKSDSTGKSRHQLSHLLNLTF
jgi:hypothetical protein